jgi:hypothetical protein
MSNFSMVSLLGKSFHNGLKEQQRLVLATPVDKHAAQGIAASFSTNSRQCFRATPTSLPSKSCLFSSGRSPVMIARSIRSLRAKNVPSYFSPLSCSPTSDMSISCSLQERMRVFIKI